MIPMNHTLNLLSLSNASATEFSSISCRARERESNVGRPLLSTLSTLLSHNERHSIKRLSIDALSCLMASRLVLSSPSNSPRSDHLVFGKLHLFSKLMTLPKWLKSINSCLTKCFFWFTKIKDRRHWVLPRKKYREDTSVRGGRHVSAF